MSGPGAPMLKWSRTRVPFPRRRRPGARDLGKEQRMPTLQASLDALTPGAALPPLQKPRLTSSHIMRWLAAQQNWDKIHYDQAYCKDFARLPGPVINGALKQHLIVQFLSEAFDYSGWVWRVDYQFIGADQVGQSLRVQGHVARLDRTEESVFVSIDFEVLNLDEQQVTTRGSAVLVFGSDGRRMLDGLSMGGAPEGLALITQVADDGSVRDDIRQKIGQVIETRTSAYPVDLSRLRMFSDAVMGLPPMFFDPAAGAGGPYRAVVGAPLFPFHGIEAKPGTLPLSEDPKAMGREGVNEVGRDPASLFGIDPVGGMNAGNKVEVHSLVHVGESIRATSTLVGARRKLGRRGGEMLFFETLNRYAEAGGRPLVTELQTIVLKSG